MSETNRAHNGSTPEEPLCECGRRGCPHSRHARLFRGAGFNGRVPSGKACAKGAPPQVRLGEPFLHCARHLGVRAHRRDDRPCRHRRHLVCVGTAFPNLHRVQHGDPCGDDRQPHRGAHGGRQHAHHQELCSTYARRGRARGHARYRYQGRRRERRRRFRFLEPYQRHPERHELPRTEGRLEGRARQDRGRRQGRRLRTHLGLRVGYAYARP